MPPRRKKEWFDNDAFWRETYSFMFPEDQFAAAPEQVEKALALAKPGGKDALDLCCGPGRCSMALAEAGFRVTGVDRTKFLLDKARARARKARIRIEWVEADMRNFVRPEAFDLVVNMWTSFGYFDEKDDDRRVLRNIYASLRPGGVCLMEMLGKERLARIYQPTTSDVLADGTRAILCHEIVDDWTRLRNEWILVRQGRAKTYRFHLTIYSGQELRDRLEQAGFTGVTLYGNLDGEVYGPDAQRLVAVAHKATSADAR